MNLYSLHAGRINPTTLEGTGAQYFEEGQNSLVVLAYDGSQDKGLRVISSYGEYFTDPKAHIGETAVQLKQQANDKDTHTYVRVVGYRSLSGETTGLVPTKTVNFFVFK